MKQKHLRALVDETYAKTIDEAFTKAHLETAIAIARYVVDNCDGEFDFRGQSYTILVGVNYTGLTVKVSPWTPLPDVEFISSYANEIILDLARRSGSNALKLAQDLIKPVMVVSKEDVRRCVIDVYQKNYPQKSKPVYHVRNNKNIRVPRCDEELPALTGNKALLEGRNALGNLWEARRERIAREGYEETHHFTRGDAIKCKRKNARKAKRSWKDQYYNDAEYYEEEDFEAPIFQLVEEPIEEETVEYEELEQDYLPSMIGRKSLLEGRNHLTNLALSKSDKKCGYESHYFTRQDELKCERKRNRQYKYAYNYEGYDEYEDYDDEDLENEDDYIESMPENTNIVAINTSTYPRVTAFAAENNVVDNKKPIDQQHIRAEVARAKLRAMIDLDDETLLKVFNLFQLQ